jgi:hypothetical protein
MEGLEIVREMLYNYFKFESLELQRDRKAEKEVRHGTVGLL